MRRLIVGFIPLMVELGVGVELWTIKAAIIYENGRNWVTLIAWLMSAFDMAILWSSIGYYGIVQRQFHHNLHTDSRFSRSAIEACQWALVSACQGRERFAATSLGLRTNRATQLAQSSETLYICV